MAEEIKKTFWSDAALGGSVTGIVVSVMLVLTVLTRDNAVLSLTFNLLLIASLAFCIYTFGKKRASGYSREAGFSLGQSIGYTMGMMLFAGVLAGIAMFVMFNMYPEWSMDMFGKYLISSGIDIASEAGQERLQAAASGMQKPLIVIMSGILVMFLQGGLIGLIAAVFIKKDPKLFSE